MMTRFSSFCLILVSALALSACAAGPGGSVAGGGFSRDIQDDNLIGESYKVGDELHRQMVGLNADAATVLFTSFVPVNDLDTSTPFGQITAEQVASRLNQNGYQIVEARLRNALAITNDGEFILSRDVTALAAEHEASAILVGTYAEANDDVYVNTRILSADTGRVMASYDYELSMGRNMISLLSADNSLGRNAEARATIMIISGTQAAIPDLHTAEEIASSHCARRGQIYTLVDRIVEWQRATSYFRCIDAAVR